jgi:hypothetical protein
MTFYSSHTHSITNYPQYVQQHMPGYDWTLSKTPEPSTLEKVRNERREARDRLKIEQMYNDYDEASLETTEDGDVCTFAVIRRDDQKRTHAALFVANKWYVTGREAPNGLATEDFVAWLIDHQVDVASLVWLSA